MSILVAYASKCGATAGIAERIAATLRAAGQESEARQVQDAGDLSDYDAFVIGSALYYGSWMKEATAFVRRNWVFLASRPVWLFSSGPIDAETTDEEGHDLREVAVPRQLAEFRETLEPRDHRVFFGRLDRGKLGLLDRLVASLPAFPWRGRGFSRLGRDRRLGGRHCARTRVATGKRARWERSNQNQGLS
jgi:menaquinone-dependent protoporphyrinogen oxidase